MRSKGIVVLPVLAIGVLVLMGAGCKREETRGAEKNVEETTREMEAARDQFAQYKREVELKCSKSVAEVTGTNIARCRDIQENETVYKYGLFSEDDKDFPNLPAFCARKVAEMSAMELLDCIKAADKKDGPLFDELGE